MAEGSFANDDDKVVVEEGMCSYLICTDTVYSVLYVVHLRKRKSDHGKLKAPSTSSITYWQIEKDEEPLSGKTYMKKDHRLCHLHYSILS